MTAPIDSSDPDARQQSALEALEASHGADPTREGFGFFSCDDHAWGCGMFHWYPSMARLLKAISQEVVHAFLDEQEDGESNALAQRLQALTESFGPVDKLGPAQFEALRSELRGVQDLRWIGTFDELCTSADEWPSEVRGRFRGQHESSYDYDADSSTTTAATERSREQRIGPDELEDFVGFVREFGY